MPIGEGVHKPVLGRFSEEIIETLNLLNYHRCRQKLPVYFPTPTFPSAVDTTLRYLNTLAWGRVLVSTPSLPANPSRVCLCYSWNVRDYDIFHHAYKNLYIMLRGNRLQCYVQHDQYLKETSLEIFA